MLRLRLTFQRLPNALTKPNRHLAFPASFGRFLIRDIHITRHRLNYLPKKL